MLRTQISLTEPQLEALKRIAAAEGISMAELIRRGIDQIIGTATAEARRHAALEIVGTFDSGQSDVSERHDDHLVEVYDA